MRIEIDRMSSKYDKNVHPEVTEIFYCRPRCDEFFDGNRFPNLRMLCFTIYFDQERIELKSLRVHKLIIIQCKAREVVLDLPDLKCLILRHGNLTKLEINCPSIGIIKCDRNLLRELEVHAHCLIELDCSFNRLERLSVKSNRLYTLSCQANLLTELDIECVSLQHLYCEGNPLISLNGLEFCTELEKLICSETETLDDPVKVLRQHLPKLSVTYKKTVDRY